MTSGHHSYVCDIERAMEKETDLEGERVLSSDKTIDSSYTSQSVENEFVVLAINF